MANPERQRHELQNDRALDMKEVALIDPPSRFSTSSLDDIKPDRVGSIMRKAAGGDLEDWMDLCDKMLETDEHLASVSETRKNGVLGRDFVIEPPEGVTPEKQGAADRAAALIRQEIERNEEFERIVADILDGVDRGISVLEHDWHRRGRRIVSDPFWVHPRNVRYNNDWRVQVRSEQHRAWVDLPQDKFIVHQPHVRTAHPTRDGLLRSVAWVWVFKFWAWTFWVTGAERAANPLLVVKVPPKSPQKVRDQALSALEQLSADQAAVIEEQTGIQPLDIKYTDSSEVWERLILKCDAAMSKRYVGSTLNVEVTATGGNRAAAESQAEQTMLPRNIADARKVAGTIRRDWFRPFLEFNAHEFNGEVPPVPQLRWVFDSGEREIPSHVFEALVDTESITRNQLLEIAGLDPLEGPEGEERIRRRAKLPGQTAGAARVEQTHKATIEQNADAEWCVYSEDGGQSFGCYPTKPEAVERLAEVEGHADAQQTADRLAELGVEPDGARIEEAGQSPLPASKRRRRASTRASTSRTSSRSPKTVGSPLRAALSPELDDPQS